MKKNERNAGRHKLPANLKKIAKNFTLSQEVIEALKHEENASKYLDNLVRKDKKI